jgi:hypothetical protein
MKKIFKILFLKIIAIDTIGNWIKKISTFVWKISYQRQLLERKKSEASILHFTQKLFKDQIVLNGPFKGLKYPSMRSKSSSLFSKLIGSYEKELSPTFEEIITSSYEQILDIGCAEGYYAVGLALKIPKVTIYAYDIDPEARMLTKKMAELNGVIERVIISSSCTSETLKLFDFKKRSLIISDTEGFEKYLFTPECLPNLHTTDILIETHDFIDINISTDLEKLFSETHNLSIIQSLGDVLKAKTYKYAELHGTDLNTRYRIFEEGRRFTDEWLYLKAKTESE